MKRLSEYRDKLVEIELKGDKINQRIHRAERRIVKAGVKRSKRDTERFIHNAHIVRFPPLRQYLPLVNDPITNIINDLFFLPELVGLVLQHMGPCELYLLTRVSRQFKIFTTDAFVQLAPYYLDRYAEDLVTKGHKSSYQATRKSLVAMTTKYKDMPIASRPPIESLLSLWDHAMILYRRNGRTDSKAPNIIMIHTPNSDYNIDYAFVYDTVNDRFMRMRDMNLYGADNYDDIKRKVRRRWKYEFGISCSMHDIIEELPLFRYDDLCGVDFVRLDKFMCPKDTFIMENDQIVKFDLKRYKIHYCIPPQVEAELDADSQFCLIEGAKNRTPFIDYYEQRLRSRTMDKNVPRTTPFYYKPSFFRHRDEVKGTLLM